MVDKASRSNGVPEGGRRSFSDRSGTLRILYGLLEFPVLSETFIVREMVGLIREGHGVHIAALHHGGTDGIGALSEDLRLLERTTFLEVPDRPLSRILRLPGALATCWSRHGPATMVRSLTHGRDATTLRPLFEVTSLPAGMDFHIAHCHFGPAGLHGLRWKRSGIVRRLVVTFHANDLVAPVAEHGPSCYAPLFAEADLLLAISEHGRRRLLDLGAPPDRIGIQPCPVDWGDRPPVDLHREPGVFRVLSVGRLVEKKGFDDAIACLATVARRHPALNFLHTIIGAGPRLKALQRQAARLPDNLRVSFSGARPPGEVERALHDADLFLLPSRTARDGDEEGLPVALMEAMALGLPVVSTHHAGIPELVDHGTSGLLAPEGDVEVLAACVERILVNPELGMRLGRMGRRAVLAAHDIHRTTATLIRHYRQIL